MAYTYLNDCRISLFTIVYVYIVCVFRERTRVFIQAEIKCKDYRVKKVRPWYPRILQNSAKERERKRVCGIIKEDGNRIGGILKDENDP